MNKLLSGRGLSSISVKGEKWKVNEQLLKKQYYTDQESSKKVKVKHKQIQSLQHTSLSNEMRVKMINIDIWWGKKSPAGVNSTFFSTASIGNQHSSSRQHMTRLLNSSSPSSSSSSLWIVSNSNRCPWSKLKKGEKKREWNSCLSHHPCQMFLQSHLSHLFISLAHEWVDRNNWVTEHVNTRSSIELCNEEEKKKKKRVNFRSHFFLLKKQITLPSSPSPSSSSSSSAVHRVMIDWEKKKEKMKCKGQLFIVEVGESERATERKKKARTSELQVLRLNKWTTQSEAVCVPS